MKTLQRLSFDSPSIPKTPSEYHMDELERSYILVLYNMQKEYLISKQ